VYITVYGVNVEFLNTDVELNVRLTFSNRQIVGTVASLNIRDNLLNGRLVSGIAATSYSGDYLLTGDVKNRKVAVEISRNGTWYGTFYSNVNVSVQGGDGILTGPSKCTSN